MSASLSRSLALVSAAGGSASVSKNASSFAHDVRAAAIAVERTRVVGMMCLSSWTAAARKIRSAQATDRHAPGTTSQFFMGA